MSSSWPNFVVWRKWRRSRNKRSRMSKKMSFTRVHWNLNALSSEQKIGQRDYPLSVSFSLLLLSRKPSYSYLSLVVYFYRLSVFSALPTVGSLVSHSFLYLFVGTVSFWRPYVFSALLSVAACFISTYTFSLSYFLFLFLFQQSLFEDLMSVEAYFM